MLKGARPGSGIEGAFTCDPHLASPGRSLTAQAGMWPLLQRSSLGLEEDGSCWLSVSGGLKGLSLLLVDGGRIREDRAELVGLNYREEKLLQSAFLGAPWTQQAFWGVGGPPCPRR